MDIKMALTKLSHENGILWYITRKIHLPVCHKCVLKNMKSNTEKDKKSNTYEAPTTLNLGSDCCHSLQNVSYSHLLLENARHKIHKADSHCVIVCVLEIWPVTTSEKHRFCVSENRVLR